MRASVFRVVRRLLYMGRQRSCPVCDASVRTFLPFGDPLRPQAACPVCESLERHRLIALWMRAQLRPGIRMLHVAPEVELGARLREWVGSGYVSGDLSAPADCTVDLSNIPFPDATFDCVYACHVLEHVPDDRTALREVLRVLKPGGWALLPFPMDGRQDTFEDASISTPEERERVFGQWNHVRRCGLDYVNRFVAAGFQPTLLPFPAADAFRYGLRDEPMWICTAPETRSVSAEDERLAAP